MTWIRSLALALALTASVAGCSKVPPALVSTNPAAVDVAKVQLTAVRVADAVNAGLVIVGEVGKLVNELPIPPQAKDALDCAIIRVTGLSGPPSATVQRICGDRVPNGPGPLHKALGELSTVTAEPSLRVTVTAVLGAIDPLLATLDQVNEPAVKALASALRATFAFARSFLGGSL